MVQFLKRLYTYRFLVFAFAAYTIAGIIESNIDSLDFKRVNVSDFQSVLNGKYQKALSSLEEIDSKINSEGLDAFIDNHGDNYFDLYQEEGIVILAFHQQNLEFWNSNILPLQIYQPVTGSDRNVVNPGNGWYVATHLNPNDSLDLFGLILIKHDYAFENEFLVNAFQADFNLNHEVELGFTPEGEKIVKDPDGDFLFSLIEPQPPVYGSTFSLVACFFHALAIVLLLLFLYKSFDLFRLSSITAKNLWLAGIIILLILIRYLMLETGYPQIFKSYSLFQPQHYAKSSFFPSLGDFLINSVFILFAAICFSVHFRVHQRNTNTGKIKRTAIVAVSSILLVVFMLSVHYMFSGLIFNSNIQLEVHNFIYLNRFSLVAYLILAILLASLVLFADRIVFISSTLLEFRSFILILALSMGAGIFVFTAFNNSISISAILFFILLSGSITGVRYFRYRYSYSFQLFLVFLISLFTLAFITGKSRVKEKNIMQVIAVNLANERDQIAEFLLEEATIELRDDNLIFATIDSPHHDDHDIYDYLRDNYFSGYFRKYELQIASCGLDTDLLLEDVNELVDCYSFFHGMIDQFGVPVSQGSGFYFLDNLNGRISYLGTVVFEQDHYPYEQTLFISLDSKIMDAQLGYPELLIEGTFASTQVLDQYSYAKYVNEQLITRSGNYAYPLNFRIKPESGEEFTYLEEGGHEHLIYYIDEENIVVLSKPSTTTIDLLTSFSYSFVFFYLLYGLALLLCKYPVNIRKWRIDFKNKIKFSMIGVLLLSLLIIGVGTVYYNIRQFENRQYENISEKIQSVLIDLEYRLGLESELTPEMRPYITGMLIRLSNVFYTDINLYDLQGNLYASSRPEIFELGLIGEQINPKAHSEMLHKKNVRLVHEESIGNLSYLSAYVPLTNTDNEVLSYINLPYFTRQSVLKKEIYTLVVAVANIYAILILITIVLAVIVSNTITKPLQLIKDKLRMLSIGRTNEQINYESDDEIGNLIKEYNRMVGELENSADLLASSERESAWREMAKQIAHEIKNPLTPMKLSIQHLQRSWDDKVDNWEELFKKTTRNLIEQIDHLSSIATAFSDFARLPQATLSEANIVSSISNVAVLFANTENVEIAVHLNGIKKLNVVTDKMQLNRIFINLLKNSIQSIPKDRKGKIEIELIEEKDMALVRVCDNGTGIPEDAKKKMFTPNFTTKSGGMGLGLAIVKNIVEQTGGSVGFSSEYQKGSCFWFRLPFATKKSYSYED
jgi:two-component system, NtrC family, nitrogen regulation sensor histidine kinase NtrY